MRSIWHIGRTVLIEAIRRKEIYVVVLISSLLIGAVMTVDFFEMEGFTKFYREFALKLMGAATAVTVIVLAARQLPREFEKRTIYPLLARPIGRHTFLLGKLLGVWLAAGFCFGLFMSIYVAGMWHLGGTIDWPLFLQHLGLQMMMMLLLATLGFLLSMLCNVDAAITFGVLLYALGATLASMMSYLYDLTTPVGKIALHTLTWAVPQVLLFDLSEKVVHAEVWDPLGVRTMTTLVAYGLAFSATYFATSLWLFRRRAL
jgi:ABC-type transport system involved in multi-copper enzyme maturation permease subunit